MKRHPLHRREFLRRLSATALAFPTIIPASALGRGGCLAPSERITGGVIGIGGPGSGAVRRYSGDKNKPLLAVCDVVASKREQAKAVADQNQGNGDCAMYADFRELLARDDIDTVYVATPDHWHALISIAAMKAGKDVYCEKPLTLTVREGRVMVDVARRYGRVLQTGSMQRSMRSFYHACSMVRAGKIGRLKYVTAAVGDASVLCPLPAEPVPDGFDYDMWLGPAPWAPYHPGRVSGAFSRDKFHWRLWRDYSGGGMTDWGAHHFDIAQWGMGMDNSGPVEIHPPQAGANRELEYVYGDGVRLIRRNDRFGSVVFHGTEGRVGCTRKTWRTDPPRLAAEGLAADEETLYPPRGHFEDFIHCVRTRQRPICDVEIGHRSATVCHIGNIALWLGRSLKWDPAREEFVGDDEANRWLDRPRREPWILG